jgi:hypothetical protein
VGMMNKTCFGALIATSSTRASVPPAATRNTPSEAA